MKELKDYIHLYLGCRAKTTGGKYGKIVSASVDGTAIIVYDNEDPRGFVISIAALKLILRPLESMSEEEAQEIGWFNSHEQEIEFYKGFNGQLQFEADSMLFLLSKGFDLFGLQAAGLAVYETEINK